jgi:LmbE family N-acetylglucosaminyl deacetylase
MLSLSLNSLAAGANILCIGAHCDDVEIGCGATLLRMARDYPDATIRWAIFSGNEARTRESLQAAASLLGDTRVSVQFFGFRESHFPERYAELKASMETVRAAGNADLVFTHRLEDRHQDHRTLAELTWNAFRNHLIMEYEIPKYEGDLGHPNVFFPASEADLDKKVAVLMSAFPSQAGRSWFTPDTFRAMARIRGVECASPTGFAEAFHMRKCRL